MASISGIHFVGNNQQHPNERKGDHNVCQEVDKSDYMIWNDSARGE
jgi:hypothetical protein